MIKSIRRAFNSFKFYGSLHEKVEDLAFEVSVLKALIENMNSEIKRISKARRYIPKRKPTPLTRIPLVKKD